MAGIGLNLTVSFFHSTRDGPESSSCKESAKKAISTLQRPHASIWGLLMGHEDPLAGRFKCSNHQETCGCPRKISGLRAVGSSSVPHSQAARSPIPITLLGH